MEFDALSISILLGIAIFLFIIFSYHFVANPTCDPPSCFFILQIKSAYNSDPDYEKSHLDNKSEVSFNKYRSLR